MAAPEAPVIKGRNQGDGNIALSWHAVPDADTYTVYEDSTSPATTEFDVLTADEVELGGKVFYIAELLAEGLHYFRVTATNVGLEESAFSNELHLLLVDTSDDPAFEPTPALRINRTF